MAGNIPQYGHARVEEIKYNSPSVTTAYKASGLVDGFVVPAARALFVGVSMGLIVGLGSAMGQAPFSPWLAGMLFGTIAMLLSFVLFVYWSQYLLEMLYGVDLNGDGRLGPPEAPTQDKVEITVRNGGTTQYFDLPGTADQLRQFAHGVVNGGIGLEKDLWSGDGKLYRTVDYKSLRGELIKRGWARYKNGSTNQTLEVTEEGRAALAEYAGGVPPTPA